MKAMILAGGLSTRLYPLTKAVPKPLVPIAGVPNAVHLINYLKSYGYDQIAINVHYLADAIHDALGDGSAYGVRLEYLHEPVLMGSAGALKAMEPFFGSDPFVVVGCDDLTDLPLDRLTAMHARTGAVATIGLVLRPNVEQYGVVVLGDDGRIAAFQEKPPPGTERSKLVNTGIYAFSREIFDFIPANEFYDFGKQVFPELLAASARFYGYDARDAYWCDIGTPDEYRRASTDVVNGLFRIANTRANGIDPRARISSTASVDGNVWVGNGAVVEENVRVIGPSVIGDGVVIERGTVLQESILWQGARVGEGANLRETIVGAGYEVPAHATLVRAVVAPDELMR